MYGLALLTIIVAGALVAPLASRPAEAGAMRGRWGYYVGYDKESSLASLRAHVRDLEYVSTHYGFAFDASGGLHGADDAAVTRLVRENGARVVPIIQNYARYADFHRLIAPPANRTRMVRALAGLVERHGYHGLNIDFEGLDPADRPYLTAFMRELYAALHLQRKLVTMAVPAKRSDVTTGWGGAYDYRALGPFNDLMLIMAYDYHYPGGPPGAVTDIRWLAEVTRYALSEFGPRKLVVGLPFYGYDWNVTTGAKATSVKHRDISVLRRDYGARVGYDVASQSGYAFYTRAGQRHEVWFESGRSFDAKLRLLRGMGVRNVGAWRLGHEDPRVWHSLRGLGVRVSAPSFSPNGDGYADRQGVSYALPARARTGVRVHGADGRVVRELRAPSPAPTGAGVASWDGRDAARAVLPNGRYTARVTASIAGSPVTDDVRFTLDNTLGRTRLFAQYVSLVRPRISGGYALSGPASVRVYVTRDGRWVRTLQWSKPLGAGRHAFTWNGHDSRRRALPDGRYVVTVAARTRWGVHQRRLTAWIDRTRPTVARVRMPEGDVFRVDGVDTHPWTYERSEWGSARLTLLRGGERVASVVAEAQRRGARELRWNGRTDAGGLAPAGKYQYRLYVVDAAGNPSGTKSGSLTARR